MSKARYLQVLFMVVLCVIVSAQAMFAQPKNDKKAAKAGEDKSTTASDNPFPGRSKSVELDGGIEWLNTSGEITLKDLRGKVVVLDFWTYCCINCMHILPDLKFLEEKYAKQLVVIGVHSAKFENERDSDNIKQAIMRYEIEHPVVNDAGMILWRKFGVNSWPTFVVIDPEGYYIGATSGEGQRVLLDNTISKLVAYHRKKKTLDETPVRFNLEKEKAQKTPLRYPGKVLADAAKDRLFISDSNHNRILITSLSGKLKEVIGTGAMGKSGGPYDKATFDHPQGMALLGETLYVADTENHMLREIDLTAKTVKTLSGTGLQAQFRTAGGAIGGAALNSPWDIIATKGKLFVAMAGPHQVWLADLSAKTIKPYAGTGREDILNGSLLTEAALAQPSGLATDGKYLYVVDSEGSAVRKMPMDGKGNVETIAGTSDLPQGQSLFAFDDKDGVGSESRLQHPLGITYHGGMLYVADSYNHKIKKLDPKENKLETYLGNGRAGDKTDPPQFSEPAGLSVAGNTLYVADTNNHRIVTIDLKTGKASPLVIEGLKPPAPITPSTDDAAPAGTPIKVSAQRVAPGPNLGIDIKLNLPAEFKLNKLAPLSYKFTAEKDQKLIAADLIGKRQKVEKIPDGDTLSLEVPLAGQTGKADLHFTLSYTYCRDGDGGLCKLNTVTWNIPLELAAGADAKPIKLDVK